MACLEALSAPLARRWKAMSQEIETIQSLRDPALPAFGLLLGEAAPDLLEAVVSEAGGRVLTARPSQVRYVPSKMLMVQYRTSIEWADSGASDEILVASLGTPVPDHVPLVATTDGDIAVWRYPHDPFLPGLAAAADPARTAEVLEILGAPDRTVRLRRRAYRPGSRAVVEVVAPDTRIYLKVVRPEKVEDLQQNHARLVDHVPIPHSYGWSKDLGLVAMQALPGRPIRKSLESGSRKLPDASQIIALLDMLLTAPEPTRHVVGPAQRAASHAALLGKVLPDVEERLDAITGAVASVKPSHETPVHGDLHSSQILSKGPTVTGLIDVDTVGLGSRADDFAGLLGHISTLSLNSPSRRSVERYGRNLITTFDRATDPAELRLRTAAAVLGFATGPFRVQQKRWVNETERRVGLAEKWVEAAAAI